MKKYEVLTPISLATILASNGLTNDIPVGDTGTFNASQNVGFPQITMQKISNGGQPPDGKDFNGFLQLLSSHLFALQNGILYTFNQMVSDYIGGYPKGAILTYNEGDNTSLVYSLIDDNTNNFIEEPSFIDGVKWIKIFTFNSDGVSALTPTTSDNSTKIATTEFVKRYFQVVSARPESPDPNIFYAIPE